jgi:hypothetical protein
MFFEKRLILIRLNLSKSIKIKGDGSWIKATDRSFSLVLSGACVFVETAVALCKKSDFCTARQVSRQKNCECKE